MAIGTYSAIRTKFLKERIYKRKQTKNKQKKPNKICKSFKFVGSNDFIIRTTAVITYLSICPVGLVWFARYCGKMYSRHLFSYGGLRRGL